MVDGKIKRVLVVDDDADNADLLQRVLKMDQLVVRVAHDGASALAAAEQFRPDAVFLDLGLPDMSGLDVARELRSRIVPTSMLIALTGYGHEEDRRQAHEAGCNHHFTKPVDAMALRKLVRGQKN